MSDLNSEAFNERFTTLDDTGEPVERMLQEMSGAAVLAAIHWHGAECDRLKREAAPFLALAAAIKAGGEPPDDLDLTQAGEAVGQMGEAYIKLGRLMTLFRASIPQWPQFMRQAMNSARTENP